MSQRPSSRPEAKAGSATRVSSRYHMRPAAKARKVTKLSAQHSAKGKAPVRPSPRRPVASLSSRRAYNPNDYPDIPHTESNPQNGGLPLPYTLREELFTPAANCLSRPDWLQLFLDLRCWPEQDENIKYLIGCYRTKKVPVTEGNLIIVQKGKAVSLDKVDNSLPWNPLVVEASCAVWLYLSF